MVNNNHVEKIINNDSVFYDVKDDNVDDDVYDNDKNIFFQVWNQHQFFAKRV